MPRQKGAITHARRPGVTFKSARVKGGERFPRAAPAFVLLSPDVLAKARPREKSPVKRPFEAEDRPDILIQTEIRATGSARSSWLLEVKDR